MEEFAGEQALMWQLGGGWPAQGLRPLWRPQQQVYGPAPAAAEMVLLECPSWPALRDGPLLERAAPIEWERVWVRGVQPEPGNVALLPVVS